MLGRARSYRPGIWARLFLAGDWKLTLDPRRDTRMTLDSAEIPCLDVTAIETTSALLWHSVEIQSSSGVETLTGLTGNAARRLRDDLHTFVNGHLARLIDHDKHQLREVDRIVGAIVDSQRQYLAQCDIGRAIAAVPGNAARALSHPLFDAALIPANVRRHLPGAIGLLTDPEARRRYNEAFVIHELDAFAPFFDGLGEFPLSDEQREACIRLEDSNLLVASAGSGKSATMVGKVAYVLEKQLHDPGEILVMAFGKPAAEELKVRIARQLGLQPGELKCRVTTFHALGLSIIKEVEGRPPQMVNWAEKPAGEARFVDDVIKELVDTDEEFRRLWIEILLLFPKAHIPPDEFSTDEEYRDYMADNNGKRPKEIATYPGIYVQSLEEQRIVNWLWLHTVEFEYERQTETRDEDGTARWLKPDFYYPASKTIHEHFAISADGTSPFENYVEHARLKRAAYSRLGADLFETTSAQARDGSLLDRLRAELEHREIALVERPHEEVLKATRPVVLAHYKKIIGVCIKHIRASGLTLDMLLQKAKSLHDPNRAERFAKVVSKITDVYTSKLDAQRYIDFDSMIGDAVKLVETGRYLSPFSLILVDEFQDISDPRAKLIKALKYQKPFTKLFAVGDDWQSIYRFTGSDLTIFTQFEENFGASWQGRLENTYRCNQTLADAASAFIQRNPAQLTKTVRSSRPAIPRSIRAIPVKAGKNKTSFADACHQVLDRLDSFLSGNAGHWQQRDGHKLKVLVLWRYNLLNPFQSTSPEFTKIEVTGKSFHSSKGLEADYTILLDVSEGDYGVPSRIEDDELLNLVIPRPETFEYAEERRLFYVALTRASRGTFLLYDRDQPSRYIAELCDLAGDDVRFESIDGTRLWQCPVCITGELTDRVDAGGATFVGCSRHPKCEHRRPHTPPPTTNSAACY